MYTTLSTISLLSVLATTTFATPQDAYGSSSATTTAGAAAASVSGVHSVAVGPALTFTPDTITAAEGDWIEFAFTAGHSVAQSSFDAPCVPLASGEGVYSGFPGDGGMWRFQVNSTSPIWLYCSAGHHCQSGMSLVVNPPSNNSSRTLDAYKSASADATTGTPDNVQGGIFGAASDDTSSAATSSTSGASTSSASSASSATGSATRSATGSATRSATGSSTASSQTGNAATANLAQTGMMLAGVVAAGVAAVL